MRRLIRLVAVAAMFGVSLVGVGLMANTASAAPCSDQSANLTDPVVVAPLGCAYVTVAGLNGCGTQVVLEDASGNLGYIGVSNCGRPPHGPAPFDPTQIVGTSVTGNTCPGRWGVNGGGGDTNGGGCYSLDIMGFVIDVDVAELGKAVPVLDLVPLPVGGDTTGDYNSTDRDGMGGAPCDVLDTLSDVVEALGGPALFPEC